MIDTWAHDTVKWYWSAGTLFWQMSIDQNIDVQCVHYQFSCAPKLAKKYEIEHGSRSSKTINWLCGQLENKSHHLDQLTYEPAIWSWDTGQWLAILFWQLSIDHIVNVLHKRCGRKLAFLTEFWSSEKHILVWNALNPKCWTSNNWIWIFI